MIESWFSEAYHQNQNNSSELIGDLLEASVLNLFNMRTPCAALKYWCCYALEYLNFASPLLMQLSLMARSEGSSG